MADNFEKDVEKNEGILQLINNSSASSSLC